MANTGGASKVHRLSFEEEIRLLSEMNEERQAEFIEQILFGGYFSDFSSPLQPRRCMFDYIILELPRRSGRSEISMHLLDAAEYGSSAVGAIAHWWTETAAAREFIKTKGTERDKLRLNEIETLARVAEQRAKKQEGTSASWWGHVKWYFGT